MAVDEPMRLPVMTLVYLLSVNRMEQSLLMNEPDYLIDWMLDLEDLQWVVRSNSPR